MLLAQRQGFLICYSVGGGVLEGAAPSSSPFSPDCNADQALLKPCPKGQGSEPLYSITLSERSWSLIFALKSRGEEL